MNCVEIGLVKMRKTSKFNWTRIGKKMGVGRNFEFPFFGKGTVNLRNGQLRLPRIVVHGKFKCYADFKNGLLKYVRTYDKKDVNTFSVRTTSSHSYVKIPSVFMRLSGWFVGEKIEVYKYIPNKNIFYVFRNKNLIVDLRKIHEKVK